jgi:3',5'-nucleoside bisphosphate phosphatase
MNKWWHRAELHVHTVLSPCASVEMIPPLIVQKALDLGIDLIAITDHNAIANISAVQQAAVGTKLHVLPGIELQTSEEVHILCFFDDLDQIQAFYDWVLPKLPNIENDPEYFGEQFIVDQTGDFIAREPRLLINSCKVTFEQAVTRVRSMGGLAIPAHVDRNAYGLFANLGFIPPGMSIDAIEISMLLNPDQAREKYPQLRLYPVIQNGDVHHLDDFCGTTWFFITQPTISEIRMALDFDADRRFEIRSLGMDN